MTKNPIYNFYMMNRRRLAEELPNSLIIIPAYAEMQQAHDMAAPFIQESNFYYLTGISRPGWIVVIDTHSNRTTIISPTINQTAAIFDGKLSNDEALQISGADLIGSRASLAEQIKNFAGQVYCLFPHRNAPIVINPAQERLYRFIKRQQADVKDCRQTLNRMRAIKQPYEIARLRRSIDLTCRAFEVIKSKLNEYKYEYEIEAEFSYYFMKRGFDHAYEPIVASGVHACTLHYNQNDGALAKNSFVLLDIGASHDHYGADITRTYALGKPNDRYREVHQAVQDAQRRIIELIKPNVAIREYIDQSDKIMRQTLVDIGLMEHLGEDKSFRRYFPHAVSHGLGLDVHDALGGYEVFQPGMVLTVEPGIYIPDEYIGIRIEDNILVTDAGNENLSAKLSTGW